MELSSHHKSIVTYLKDENGTATLSESQKEMLEKLETAYALLIKHKSINLATAVMVKMDKWNSPHTAKRDLAICQQMFGNVNETSKQIKRQIVNNMILQTRQLAFNAKDIEAMIKCEKNYISANALNKDEVDMPDFDALVIPESPIVIDIDFLNAYADRLDVKILEKIKEVFLSSKIFKYVPELAETIPFEMKKE